MGIDKRLPEWGRSNFWLKLASMGVALCLFLIVQIFFSNSEDNSSVLQFLAPVEVKGLPADKMLIWPPPVQVELTLKGPSMFLSRIQRPVFSASVPPEAGNRFTVRLSREQLSLPPYVEVLGIKPHEVEFTLDDKVSKKVPVIVPRVGTLSDSYKLEGFKVEPETIELIGPSTEIKGIKNIETAPFDFRDLQETAEKELDLRITGTFVSSDVKRVAATAQISSVIVEQKFENLQIEVRSPTGKGAEVKPASVAVKVSGPRAFMKTLTADLLIPYVKIPAVLETSQNLPVLVDRPEKVSLLSVEPGSAVVSPQMVPTVPPTATPKKQQPKKTADKK